MRASAIKQMDEIMVFDIEDRGMADHHTHQDIEFLYVLEGKMTLRMCSESFNMKTGDMAVINSGQVHGWRTVKGSLIGVIHICYFRLMQYMDLDQYEFRCNSVIDRNKGYEDMGRILDKIFRLYFEREKEKVYLNSLYFELLHVLIDNFSFMKDPRIVTEVSDEARRVQEILKYIHTYYQYPIRLNDMAEQLHLSCSYLSKFIKKHLGMNFLDYVNHVRMERAEMDLKTTDKSITRIAMDNGFPNTTAFSNAFRKIHGSLPSAWVKEKRRNFSQKRSLTANEQKEKSIHRFLERRPELTVACVGGESLRVAADREKSHIYVKNWNRMINVGSVSSLLRGDLKDHLKILHRELGFSYVRFWDVFSPDMLTDYRHAGQQMNFALLDKALDFLLEEGMRPFIELGFKPVILTRTVDRSVMTMEREERFESSEDYAAALRSFIVHCVNRYGAKEVEQWYFEQWADPRMIRTGGYDKYFEIFEQSRHVLCEICPDIRIGGAGFGRLYTTLEFQDIIDLWKKRPCRPDFISLYGYPYMARSSVRAQNNDRIRDPGFLRNQILMMDEVLKKAKMDVPELMVTEWSSSVSDWNCLNDSVHKGAFILKTIIDNIDTADLLGYWLASDVLTQYFDTGKLLHGGNGLISADGIKKPAFYAMEFAGKLYDHLLFKNEYAIVTWDGMDRYAIACHHYTAPNYKYFLKQEDDVDVDKQFLLFDDGKILKLHISIANVENGQYVVRTRSVGESSGSVQDAWRALSFSEVLNTDDVEYLKASSMPKLTATKIFAAHGVLELDICLEPQEFQSICIFRQM